MKIQTISALCYKYLAHVLCGYTVYKPAGLDTLLNTYCLLYLLYFYICIPKNKTSQPPTTTVHLRTIEKLLFY